MDREYEELRRILTDWQKKIKGPIRWQPLLDRVNQFLQTDSPRKAEIQELFDQIQGNMNAGKKLGEVQSALKALFSERQVALIELSHRKKPPEAIEKKLRSLPGIRYVVELLIIVRTIDDCYRVSDVIESRYGLEKKTDYVTKPWSNGYQSLHINFKHDSETMAQLEVRTPEMHTHAMNMLRRLGPRFWENPGFKIYDE